MRKPFVIKIDEQTEDETDAAERIVAQFAEQTDEPIVVVIDKGEDVQLDTYNMTKDEGDILVYKLSKEIGITNIRAHEDYLS